MKRSIFIILCLFLGLNSFFLDSALAKARKKAPKAPAAKEIEDAPYHVPIELLDALKENNLDAAIRAIRLEATTPRPKFLLKQMITIHEYEHYENGKKAKKNFATIFNLGAAYHNLFLFLKGHDAENKKFFQRAMKYYGKAKTLAPSDKKEGLLLTTAALYWTNGDSKKATSLFKKIHPENLHNEFKGAMVLALYYSSMGDIPNAIQNLELAYNKDPEFAKLWLRISDDFVGIYKEPEFQSLLQKWKVRPRT